MIQSATAVVSLLGYNMFPPTYSVSLPAAAVTHMDQIKDGLSQEVDTTRMCVCMTLHRSIRNTVRGPNFCGKNISANIRLDIVKCPER